MNVQELSNKFERDRKNYLFQQMVNWFVFFMVFPCINILDNSITFYFFLYLLAQLGLYWRKQFIAKPIFVGLMMVVILAAVLAPYSDMPRYRGFFHTLQMSVQYIYWILTACFFVIFRKNIDMIQLSKWVLIGLIFFTIGFYAIDIRFGFGVGNFSTRASRNAFVFNMLCSVPLAFYYIKHRWGLSKVPYFLVGFIIILLFTNGRSGGIIILIEALIISAILYPNWLRVLKVALIPLFVLYFLFQADGFQPLLDRAGFALESINPRLSGLLTGNTVEGNLRMDRSWLERKLQVEKGLEIIGDYPFFGVGPGNYTSYDARLANLASYERLSARSADYFNQRSAHNSYILLMGEFGLAGFLLFVSLQALGMLNLFSRIFKGQINESHLPLVSLLGLSMHFYAIVALVGAITWFTLGLAISVCTLNYRKWF
jgi:O-antigen ligase